MCFHNFTSHNGCGHVGESHTQPWTLCDDAIARLNAYRGPGSPPISPAAVSYAPPKRSGSTRRFFSLSRSSTTASHQRTISETLPALSRDSTSSSGSYTPAPASAVQGVALNYASLPDHQLFAVKCEKPIKSTHVSREMDVCKTCKRALADMRSMLARYDQTGSIRGTAAFEQFLKDLGDGGGERNDDMTIPLDDCDGGAMGARQAIIMGYPSGELDNGGGLEAIVRRMNAERGFYD
jgi:hypothetical protein